MAATTTRGGTKRHASMMPWKAKNVNEGAAKTERSVPLVNVPLLMVWKTSWSPATRVVSLAYKGKMGSVVANLFTYAVAPA